MNSFEGFLLNGFAEIMFSRVFKKAFVSLSAMILAAGLTVSVSQASYSDDAVLESPRNLSTVVDNSNSSITVSWVAPGNASDFTDVKYVVTESPDGQSFTTENLSQTFNNLSIGPHSFSVKATGVEDNGVPQTIIQNFGYTGSSQEFTVPYTGSYKLEVWGAQGGSGVFASGKGGYSKGNVVLSKDENLYIFVGGSGNVSSGSGWVYVQGGWNGGGGSRSYNTKTGSGGGSTDITLINSTVTVDSYQRYVRSNGSYLARIIVAGGGGGNGRHETPLGYGGGISGGGPNNSAGIIKERTVNVDTGGAGTQTSGGNAELYPNPDYSSYRAYSAPGIFGAGGTYYSNHESNTAAGGGGAGWYGGGVNSHGEGGGGSGYVLTSSSYKPSGYTPTSDYWMTDAQTIAGNQSFPAPSGGTEVGHSGNGYARITFEGVPLSESNSVSTNAELFEANLTIDQISQTKENVKVSWSIDGNYTGVSYKITDDISQQAFTTPDTDYTFNNLSKGSHNFTVEAYNNSGQKIAEISEEFSVKVAPTIENLTITQTQEDKALVKWSVADNGGDEITKTTLTVNNSDSIHVDGNVEQAEITLSLGINDLKIVSENTIGESNELTGSVDMKKTPSRVRNLQVIKKQNKVTVSWTPPVGYETTDTPQGFRGVTGAFYTMDAEVTEDEGIEYLVESIPEGLSTTTTDNSVTFDLDEGDDTDYQFKVTPIMPFGSGEPNYTKPLSEGNNNGEVNIFIESSISLTIDDTDDSVSLKEIPGVDNVTDTDNQMTYSVRSNNLEGYNVTIQADQEKLLPSDTNTNLDSIPVSLLTIEQPDTDTNGTSAGIQTLSHTENKLLYSQNERSVEEGDSFTSLFSLTEVPFVNADDYSGTVTYTATVN